MSKLSHEELRQQLLADLGEPPWQDYPLNELIQRGWYAGLFTRGAGGVASLDSNGKLVEDVVPDRLGVAPSLFDAVGDGIVDDTLRLQNALNFSASLGVPLDLESRTYLVTASLTLPNNTYLRNGVINCTTAATRILSITGSNVTVDGITINGRHAEPTSFSGEYAIEVIGTSASAPVTDLVVKNVTIRNVGMYGLHLKWVEDFYLFNNSIYGVGYAGIGCTSAIRGTIASNNIDTVPVSAVFSDNGYGIFLSRSETDSLLTDPHTTDVKVVGNRVHGVPWEGIDTHGGLNIVISDNTVTRCGIGIASVGSDNSANVTTWAPRNIVISNNTIDSQVDDGSAKAGISLAGASDLSLQQFSGIVSANCILRHGKESDSTTGAIRVRNTNSLTIANNIIYQPSPHGICLLNDNFGIVVIGNVIIDQWSATVSSAAAITLRAGHCSGVVNSNTHRNEGSKAAALHKNARGYDVSLSTNLNILFGINKLDECSIPVNGTNVGSTSLFNVPSVFESRAAFKGSAGTPGLVFGTDINSGFYGIGTSDFGLSLGSSLKMRWLASALLITDGYNISLGSGSGSKIGAGAGQKLGFWGATPVVRPSLTYSRTGETTAEAQLRAALTSAGLVTDSTVA